MAGVRLRLAGATKGFRLGSKPPAIPHMSYCTLGEEPTRGDRGFRKRPRSAVTFTAFAANIS